MNLKKIIREVPDFPKKWINFKDISPILESPEAFCYCIDEICKNIHHVDKIVWLDARWFIFWAAIAHKLQKPFVMIRKTWKLPHKTISESYELEYWNNSFDIHIDSIKDNDKVVIIDDLLATWWTARAAINLIEKLWWEVTSLEFIVMLDFLQADSTILKWYNINSLTHY